MEILIATNHLCEFGGSELVSVELAEQWAALGNKVTLYAPEIEPPLLPTIDRDNITLTTQEPEDLARFDIIWSHHGLIIDKYNRKNKRSHQLIVSNHMSSYLALEQPRYNASDVDMIFCNSEETRLVLPTEHRAKCELFQNPAPALTVPMRAPDVQPTGVSISNHRPADLVLFMVDKSKEINFEVFGKNTKHYERISPNTLTQINADFVICNGKSTQYALMAKLPVFIFDSFGGCGWLNKDNFAQAEHYNFSGRGFNHPPLLSSILEFEDQRPIELGYDEWKFNLPLWIKRKGLF